MVRCRACIKCKTYLIIHPENPINQVEIKNFEKKHTAHTIMTVDLSEVKGLYAPFKNNGAEKTSVEAE
ncbi:MAG: hypothetical protein ACXABO_05230 [Promethearchaeota archaeon]|jgi:hypothetical protein